MKKFNQIGFKTAIISFIIGTLFLLTYAISHVDTIAFFGYIYLIIAFITNVIIAVFLFVLSITQPNNRLKNLKTIAVMLLNIPIAYLYIILVFDYLKL